MIEQKILEGLITSEDYLRQTKPFLKDEYFKDFTIKTLFNLVNEYVDKYNKVPNVESLKVDLSNLTHLSEDQYSDCSKYLQGIGPNNVVDSEWLTSETEKFCQTQAVYNAIMESIQILDGKTKTSKGAIPALLTDALSVSFILM